MYYWLLGLAAVGVLAWLSTEENQARQDYYNKSQRLAQESNARKQQLNALRHNKILATDFYKHIELHHASVQTANTYYELYNDHKNIVKMMRKRIKEFDKNIISLKKQRDDNMSYEQKNQIRQELKKFYQYHKEAKAQLEQLYTEKTKLLEQVRLMNTHTKELKLYIANHCGVKGRDWYARLKQRHA